jgi:hypothetical protein
MEDLKGWATLVGAVVAGLTGLLNAALQIRGKRDQFKVDPYSSSHRSDPRDFMQVINLSDHPIQLLDWGWIDKDGRLRSIRDESGEPDFEGHESITVSSPKLESRNEMFLVGYRRTKSPIGAYARSATQKCPKISFKYDVPALKRLKVRIRTWWLGSTYLH